MARRRDYTRGGFTRGSITGTREAAQLIRDLGENVYTAAKAALKSGAGIIVQDAKSRCPVSDRNLEKRGLAKGALRDSIKAIARKNGAEYRISAEAKDEKGVYYGQFVEFDPRIDKPFLYPAMDANREQVKENIAKAIRAELQKRKR